MYCIGHYSYSLLPTDGSDYDPGDFNGVFNDSTKQALHKFQTDVALTVRDEIGIDEWMSLIVSTGNPNRTCPAFDCATRISYESAQILYNSGYRYVGRYLTGTTVNHVTQTRIDKNLLRPEMTDIFKAQLRLFVIYQDARQYYAETGADSLLNYFSETQGKADAEKAFSAAKSLGVPRNSIIYFAVDYDFMESQVNSMVIPYFKGVHNYADAAGNVFRIGIYGSRNTCTLVKNAGYSVSSFVSDLSTGYSGNMGYPLPTDWAFDQIKETASNGIGVDNDLYSGRYNGFNSFESSYDNEWDLIYDNGNAYALVTGPGGNGYPQDTGAIDVYWAKVKNSDGTFSAKYPMYESIKVGEFYSRRNKNTDRDDADGDNIRYVYFRDTTGKLNAGYIDEKYAAQYSDPFGPKDPQFVYEYMGNCPVFRDSDGQNASIYPTASPTEDTKVDEIVTTSTSYYTSGGKKVDDTLAPGTRVEIQAGTGTGRSYPYLTICTAKMLPGIDTWIDLIPGSSYGFIDLGFEHGVMPNDRNLITGINA